jgi:hypothetical protein
MIIKTLANSKKKILPVIILLALVIGVLLFLNKPNSTNLEPGHNSAAATVNIKPTIATEWQWQQGDKTAAIASITTDSGASLPFTAESVYNALQAVKIDADGNIILDHDALISLDETLERIHNKLDGESLGLLQEMIEKALPGKAGEQTAKMVADYYHFLGAKQEFSQINEAMADTDNEGSLESIQTNEALYSELQALREVHIGNEATAKLFRISDANARYMFESMKLESDNQLTQEEKNNLRKEINQRHIDQSINISDWPTRFQQFKTAKQRIIKSSSNNEVKRKQLQDLLRQHFDNEELKRIEYLGLGQL